MQAKMGQFFLVFPVQTLEGVLCITAELFILLSAYKQQTKINTLQQRKPCEFY